MRRPSTPRLRAQPLPRLATARPPAPLGTRSGLRAGSLGIGRAPGRPAASRRIASPAAARAEPAALPTPRTVAAESAPPAGHRGASRRRAPRQTRLR
eukprot:1174349-Prymnesium_polylepis.2